MLFWCNDAQPRSDGSVSLALSQGQDIASLQFLFDGDRVGENQTPEEVCGHEPQQHRVSSYFVLCDAARDGGWGFDRRHGQAGGGFALSRENDAEQLIFVGIWSSLEGVFDFCRMNLFLREAAYALLRPEWAARNAPAPIGGGRCGVFSTARIVAQASPWAVRNGGSHPCS